ncbi:hypothetical protein [Clostridium thailandense]|uniref:hypothetical protein n=1 Tax=Clostridium thailandense TaxID=2794346 RepID=UPI003988F3F0
MDSKNLMEAINDVNQRLEYEYNKWNATDDSYIIEESIWIIKSLEVRLNNLYTQAKKYRISSEEITHIVL